MNYSELFTLLAPETLLVIAALGVLFIDLTTLRGEDIATRMSWGAWLTVGACFASGIAAFLAPAATPTGYLDGMLVLSPLSPWVKAVILLLTGCTAIVSLSNRFTEHAGEYFALLILATAGMLFLVSTENLLLIFVALELLSLCLYVMTAFNKRNLQSAEAALKYFLIGGISAAFLLFGFSLVYGVTSELNLAKIAPKLASATPDPLLLVGMLMVVAGFGFKVAAVPFHLWAPDAYEGAPLPSAAFIASGSKVASFFILAKLMMLGFANAAGSGAWMNFSSGWIPILAVVAGLSVIVGNVAAIAQSSVRRLLAYSAVAHTGYALVGILANQKSEGLASVIYYVATYAVTSVGIFAVVGAVQDRAGHDKLPAFAGLSKREPVLAFCLMIFLLSLAGIPPLAGFFGKFYLFKSGLLVKGGGSASLGMLWLVVLALAMSAVSLYYYLRVLKEVYVCAAAPDAPALEMPWATKVVAVVLAFVVVLLGCLPGLLVNQLVAALSAGGN